MRGKTTKLLALSFLTILLTSCGGFSSNNGGNGNGGNNSQIEDNIHATSITLKDESVTLYGGQTYQIEYEINPSNAVEKDVTYIVADESICTVSSTGLVTAKNYEGSTKVRVALKDRPGIFKEFTVNSRVRANAITLKNTSVSLMAGETYQIEYGFTPSNASGEVVYSVADERVCTVSETGLVTANDFDGYTMVRIALKDFPDIYSEMKVTSKARILVNKILVSTSRLDFIYAGETKSFTYTVLPINATDKSVEIYIEDPTIASLNQEQNEVTALKNGSTNLVIASLQGGETVEAKIAINVNDESLEEVVADPSLDPTQYLTYKELVGTTNQDILTSTATKDNPANVLVVPVEFKDITFDDVYGVENGEEVIKNELEIAFNGTPEETNYWESVSSYFEKSSFGNLNLNFDVTDVVTLSFSTDDILNGTEDVGGAVYEAFYTMKSSNPDYDFTKYDYDSDGLMDAVWFVYSAPDYGTDPSFSDANDSFWAFVTCFTTFLPSVTSPNICTFGWASYDFMYGKGDEKIDAHTYIHETGHLLGLNDYYDYTNTRSPLGLYDMQDCNVGDHNVWTKTSLGRIDPIIVDTSKNIPAKVHLNPRENGGAIFITNDYSGSAFDEYLVLELYTPNGLNELDSTTTYDPYYGRMPQTSGVKLYHVNSRLCYVGDDALYYYDAKNLVNGIPEDTTLLIAASNTYSHDRNHTAELFEQIELISSNPNGGSYTKRFGPYSASDLFQTGDRFDMNTYRAFTYNNYGVLDSGERLDIEIYFSNVSEEGADIVIVPKE